jgi:hypothetical protein
MSDLTGAKLDLEFRSGTISNIDATNLLADVTVGGVLYTSIDIHYHCDSEATEHGNPFSDNDNVVVTYDFDTSQPVEIVGFVGSPRACGNILVELDDGTKELYDIYNNVFTEYLGDVEDGNKYYWCPEEELQCNSNYQRTEVSSYSTSVQGEECPEGSEFFLRETDNYYVEDYQSEFGDIADFMDAHRNSHTFNCCLDPPSAHNDDVISGEGVVGNVRFRFSALYNNLNTSIPAPLSMRPSVVHTAAIEKFLVLSYGSNRDYTISTIWNESCTSSTFTQVYNNEDFIQFCENGVCTEFEHTLGSTITQGLRHDYTITDFEVFIHQYIESVNIFFSVFKANGNYYCHVGKSVDDVFSVARDNVFESRYTGLDIVKVQIST